MDKFDAHEIASFFQKQLETVVSEGCVKFTLHRLPPEKIKEVAYEVAKALNEPVIIEGLIKKYPKLEKEKIYTLFNS